MKISLDSKVEASDREVTTIRIEFNPQNPEEDGMASMIMAVCDTVRQLTFLQEVVQSND